MSRTVDHHRTHQRQPLGIGRLRNLCHIAAMGGVLLGLGCSAVSPRPRTLAEVDLTRRSPSVLEAQQLAPQTYLLAEKLRTQADEAYGKKDLATAQVLSEHALAAYAHAVVLARLAKANRRSGEAENKLRELQKQLDDLDQQQARMATEADDLELRAKVLRDAVPLPGSPPVSGERALARREAGRNLAAQARILCAAAQLLGVTEDRIQPDLRSLDALDADLAGPAGNPRQRVGALPSEPIDRALRLRSTCLEHLTEARRAPTHDAPAGGAPDALLTELGRAGSWLPVRDDRGVIVVLRAVFAAEKLTPAAEAQLGELGQVAKAHPAFPLLVVIHNATGAATPADKVRAQAITEALKKAGAPRVESQLAGDAQPVVDPKRPKAGERNQRVEIVYIAPTY